MRSASERVSGPALRPRTAQVPTYRVPEAQALERTCRYSHPEAAILPRIARAFENAPCGTLPFPTVSPSQRASGTRVCREDGILPYPDLLTRQACSIPYSDFLTCRNSLRTESPCTLDSYPFADPSTYCC